MREIDDFFIDKETPGAAEIAEEAPRSVRAEWDPINKMARAVELLAEISRWLEGKTRSDVIRAQESLKRILENSK